MRYLVTGSRGFVGRHLCDYLAFKKIPYIGIVRSEVRNSNEFEITNFFSFEKWSDLFKDITTVIHLAAKVHDMSGAPIDDYLKINRDLTEKIALEARKAGVKKFIFLSTIKVNGDYTNEEPFKADDRPRPSDPYAVSKMEAENVIMKLHQPGVFDVTIIRPPLIYGEGVKANFRSLINLTRKKWPLPFGSIHNKRSFVSVYNLVDLITTCAVHDKAPGKVFLVSDGDDMSLPDIIRKIGKTIGVTTFLVPFPVFLIRWISRAVGKYDYYLRLCANLTLNIDQTCKTLQWHPPYSTDESLVKMIQAESK